MVARIRQVEMSGVPDPLPGDLVVLDVREPAEWASGHIDGAVHVPLRQLPGRLNDIPMGRQVLVVCEVGARSARATAFLQGQGRDVVNLVGGMTAWRSGGRPTTGAR